MKIEIQHLQKRFDQRILFDDFNCTIHSNQITCLHGVSGCGKTTLLNMIGLIEKKDQGIILYDGKEITKNRIKRDFLSKKISFVFQNFGLIENESVYENMQLIQTVKKSKKKEKIIKEALKKVGLENTIHQKVYELSGGEQQRIALAKIFLKDSELILADEPTASLDQENKELILNYFKELKESGKTIVIVSHDSEVKAFCDCCIELKTKNNFRNN